MIMSMIIIHMIGEDATNQILAFHSNMKQVEKIMDKYLYANLIIDDDNDSNSNADKADNNDKSNNVNNNNSNDNSSDDEVVADKEDKTKQQHQHQHDNARLVKSFDSLKDTVSRLGLMETSYLFYYMRAFQYLLQFIVSILICCYAAPYCNSIVGGISIGMVSEVELSYIYVYISV